jgi:hypothetical protein
MYFNYSLIYYIIYFKYIFNFLIILIKMIKFGIKKVEITNI